MAASDATPAPIKNTALRIQFGLWLTTGLINSGAAGLDSEVSKDSGTFADCTNEATEVATSSGTYYLDLTSTEMNADIVSIQVKSSTTNAITYKCTIYPQSLGKIKVDVQSLLGTAWLAPGTAGTPDVNVKLWNALTTVELPLVPTTAGRKLDVSTGGEAGLDWANVGSPTTTLALTGTTIAVTQKVDVDTIKTNPVVNAGTITFPTTATLASTTNITAGTITTVTNLTNAPTAGDLTATMKTSVTTAATAATPTIAGTQTFNNTGTWTGNIVGTLSTLTTYTGNTVQTGDSFARIGATGSGLTSLASAANVSAIKTKTDFLPSATAGSAGGLMIAGSNAATTFATFTITGAMTADSITIAGATTFQGGLSAATLSVNGATTFGDTVDFQDDVTIAGILTAANASNNILGANPTTTDGAVPGWRIVDQGTAQSAASTSVVLRAASAFGTNVLAGMQIDVFGSTQGYWQTREITANVTATDTVTVAAFSVTPSGTITYKIRAGVASSGGGGGLTQQQVADALKLAPTAGSPAAGSVMDELSTIISQTAGLSGSGAYAITVTVTDGSSPLQNATVRVQEGINTFTVVTGALGTGTFSLDAATYTVTVTKDGYSFTPTTRTVTGTQAGTLVNTLAMTVIAPNPPPADPGYCVIYGYLRSTAAAEFQSGITVSATLSVMPAKAGGVLVDKSRDATTDENGYFELPVPINSSITPAGTTWLIRCQTAGISSSQTLNGASFDIATLIT